MLRPYIQAAIFLFGLINNSGILACGVEDSPLARIEILENSGLDRELEYVVCSLQIPAEEIESSELQIVAVSKNNGENIPCQIFNRHAFKEQNIVLFQVIFPVTLGANESKSYLLMRTSQNDSIPTDLFHQGKGLEIIVENEFYRADLTKSDQSEPKSNSSGQLRELFLKMGFDLQLFRTENRMHWAPNFQNRAYNHYETIAGWENPENYVLDIGPYLVYTLRYDQAPRHPEIELTANYYFYAGLPYFRFYSSMEITDNIWLFLLRNDEMTMDSLFTHVAFQRPDGQIEDLAFSDRYKILEEKPIENNATWLCFYNADKDYAFGSIRLNYDTKNIQGFDSPTYLPHTKISDGAGGGKYWNRRLIHEYPTLVPKGSRYIEENAYLVFRIDKKDRFKKIKYWADRLHHPLEVKLQYQ
jgi:hypothetical protein